MATVGVKGLKVVGSHVVRQRHSNVVRCRYTVGLVRGRCRLSMPECGDDAASATERCLHAMYSSHEVEFYVVFSYFNLTRPAPGLFCFRLFVQIQFSNFCNKIFRGSDLQRSVAIVGGGGWEGFNNPQFMSTDAGF